MTRVSMVATLTLALLAAPLAAAAEPRAPKKPRIGFVYWNNIPADAVLAYPHVEAILAGLEALHWVKDRDFILDVRTGEGHFERVPRLVASLVADKVDLLLFVTCGPDFHVARQATRTIPILVGPCPDDLVGRGIISSLTHPGGNITGISELAPQLSAKRLSLLKEVMPTLSRVAVLWNPDVADFVPDWQELRAAAAAMAVTLHSVEAYGYSVQARGPLDRESVLALLIARARADGLLGFSDRTHFFAATQFAGLSVRTRLPSIYAYREVAEAGGLMSYGPNLLQLYRRVATYVDKILKGAEPADLPVEQPTEFELVINLKTAKALGLTIPPSVLTRAARENVWLQRLAHDLWAHQALRDHRDPWLPAAMLNATTLDPTRVFCTDCRTWVDLAGEDAEADRLETERLIDPWEN